MIQLLQGVDPLEAGSGHRLRAAAGGRRRHSAPVATSAPFITASGGDHSELFGYAAFFLGVPARSSHPLSGKPLVCVADSICMGGGIDLFTGAAFPGQ